MDRVLAIILLTTFISPSLHAEITQSSVPPELNNDLIKSRLLNDSEYVFSNIVQQNEDDLYVEIVDLDFQQNEFNVTEHHHVLTGKQQRYNEFSLIAEKNYKLQTSSNLEVIEPKPVKSSNTFVSESTQLNYSPWGWGWGYGAQWGGWPYYPHRWYY